MTAAQKTAKANFKKAIEYRKKTGVSLKEAFAHVYGKKVGAAPKKKAAKKAAPKKAAKKVVKKAAPKKAAKKKVSEKQVLNKIHKVKDQVSQLDELQHKHMLSGLKKIVGIPHKAKYYISYTTDNGIKKVEYFEKLPTGRYKGMDRVIYLTRLTNSGTSLIPVKLTSTDKELKK
jgi:hypothetical protein